MRISGLKLELCLSSYNSVLRGWGKRGGGEWRLLLANMFENMSNFHCYNKLILSWLKFKMKMFSRKYHSFYNGKDLRWCQFFFFNEFHTMAWNSLSSLTTIKQTGQETQGRVPLLRAVSLDHWLIVYTKGNYETALTLQQNLQWHPEWA